MLYNNLKSRFPRKVEAETKFLELYKSSEYLKVIYIATKFIEKAIELDKNDMYKCFIKKFIDEFDININL